MGAETKIEWCDHTFNAWRGCTKVAPGCANCYAETGSLRNPGVLGIWGPDGTRVVAAEAKWKEVEKWNRDCEREYETARAKWVQTDLLVPPPWPHEYRRKVFCHSLSDVFEAWDGPMVDSRGRPLFFQVGERENEWTPDGQDGPVTMGDVRARLFRLIDCCRWLDFLLVTKRPENIPHMWPATPYHAEFGDYRPNVWLLTSISDQKTADEAMPHLFVCGGLTPVLGLSIEPLLGPVDLESAFTKWVQSCPEGTYTADVPALRDYLQWVIVGGESGPNARPCRTEWIRDIVEQCREAGVPCFVKQLGSNPVWTSEEIAWRWHEAFSDPKGGDPDEWPEVLRVRQFPEVGR